VKEKIDEISKPVIQMTNEYFRKQGFENPLTETLIFGALLDGIGFHYIMDPENYPLESVKEMLLERYAQKNKKP
jgi:hypothetical protein